MSLLSCIKDICLPIQIRTNIDKLDFSNPEKIQGAISHSDKSRHVQFRNSIYRRDTACCTQVHSPNPCRGKWRFTRFLFRNEDIRSLLEITSRGKSPCLPNSIFQIPFGHASRLSTNCPIPLTG
jgi:hypothetical protein